MKYQYESPIQILEARKAEREERNSPCIKLEIRDLDKVCKQIEEIDKQIAGLKAERDLLTEETIKKYRFAGLPAFNRYYRNHAYLD